MVGVYAGVGWFFGRVQGLALAAALEVRHHRQLGIRPMVRRRADAAAGGRQRGRRGRRRGHRPHLGVSPQLRGHSQGGSRCTWSQSKLTLDCCRQVPGAALLVADEDPAGRAPVHAPAQLPLLHESVDDDVDFGHLPCHVRAQNRIHQRVQHHQHRAWNLCRYSLFFQRNSEPVLERELNAFPTTIAGEFGGRSIRLAGSTLPRLDEAVFGHVLRSMHNAGDGGLFLQSRSLFFTSFLTSDTELSFHSIQRLAAAIAAWPGWSATTRT